MSNMIGGIAGYQKATQAYKTGSSVKTEKTYAKAETAAGKADQNLKTTTFKPVEKGSSLIPKAHDKYGVTIGNAQLSEKAAEYYDKLKSKYNDMDFILVSKDMKDQAQANAGAFANPNKMVVLIDEDKIEQMAVDEKFRAQYEGLIEKAANNLSALKEKMDNSGQSSNILGYGLEVKDDGEIGFFAVLRKSAEAQKGHIEKVTEKHQAEKKAAAKKAAKEAFEESLKPEDTEVIRADSIEELLQKVGDYNFADRSNIVKTEQEMQIGQSIDFKG